MSASRSGSGLGSPRFRLFLPAAALALVLGFVLTAVPTASAAPAPGPVAGVSPAVASPTPVSSTTSAGYLGFNSATITAISAQWNVPKVTCLKSLKSTQTVFPEILLEGASPAGSKSPVVALVLGTLTYCTPTARHPTTEGFLLFLGSNNVTHYENLTLKLSGGNIVRGSITVSTLTSKVDAYLENVNTTRSQTRTEKVANASVVADAYWLVSTTGVLGKFASPVNFTDAFYVSVGMSYPISALPVLYEVTMVDKSKHTMATVSALNSTGNGFLVTWKRSK
jgi:hypothetical protein